MAKVSSTTKAFAGKYRAFTLSRIVYVKQEEREAQFSWLRILSNSICAAMSRYNAPSSSSQYGKQPEQQQQQQQQQASGLRSMDSKHVPIVVLRCKLVLVGDACVGKSALTQVFSSGGATYPKNYLMTGGAELAVKQVPLPDTNVVVELYIFDCAGQSIFNQLEMNSKYYENASAIMAVFDISKKDSLQSCVKWVSSVRAARQGGAPLLGALVGNKCEFRDGSVDTRAEVVREDGQRLANDLGLSYFEASAASNINVELPFKHIAAEFYRRYEDTAARAEEDLSSFK